MIFNLDFIFLNILLTYVFVRAGKNISKGGSYWHNACWCIALFTFVQGCRFARGTDYHGYSNTFIKGNHVENPFFSYINEFLKNVGVNQYSCFMVYAFIFVLCAMIFMHGYRKYAKYMFPLFLAGFLLFEESMIRQAFSYSFFFLFLRQLFFMDRENIKEVFSKKINLCLCVFWGILTVAVHTGNIINILAFCFFYFFFNKPIPPLLSIPFYICCVYLFPNFFNFSYLNSFIGFLSEYSTMAASYGQNTVYWFSTEGLNDLYEKNIFAEVFQILGSSSLMYLGYSLIKKNFQTNRMLIAFLNTFILGLCIESVFVELEILHRIGQVMDILGYFLLAIILYYKPANLHVQYKLIFLTLSWFLYYYIKYIFFSGKVSMFIWDTPYSFF